MHHSRNFAFDSSRMMIYCREQKREYPVKKKKDKECYYINVGNDKLTVTDIVKPMLDDYCFRYLFEGWIFDYPCPAFHWWYIRYREKEQITMSQFKIKYAQVFKSAAEIRNSRR